MKYLTKEWYWRLQHQIFFDLKIEPREAQFSEELFQELYQKEELKWLNEQREFEERVGANFDDFGEKVLFKPLAVKQKYYNEAHKIGLHIAKNALSQELLNQIADLRVFELGYVTQDVADAIEIYDAKCKKETMQIRDEWLNLRRELFKFNRPDWFEEFDFHDATINMAKMYGEDFFITLMPITYPQAEKTVIFRKANIVKQDSPLEGTVWLYNEIYPLETGYEIHVLLWKSWNPIELTLICENVEYVDYEGQ